MPQNAQVEIEDGLKIARAWDDARRELAVRETQLMVKGLALQAQSIIAAYSNPEWILNILEETQLESLR